MITLFIPSLLAILVIAPICIANDLNTSRKPKMGHATESSGEI